MSCSRPIKEYPTNRVYPKKYPELGDELVQGITIHHPITRCSATKDLHEFASKGQRESGLYSYRNHENERYYFNLPFESQEDVPNFIKAPNCHNRKDFKTVKKTSGGSLETDALQVDDGKMKMDWPTLDEVDLVIRKELAKKRHSIKSLFKEQAADGNGRVSKGTLLKIVASLCPKINIELFHRLLERYSLDGEALVSFRNFEEAFTAAPLGTCPPPVIFYGLGAERCVSVAQAYKMLQEIACDPTFDLKRLLPPSCFEPNGRVLCPQLRQAMKLMRINLTDENFRRLWRDKLDLERFGSIRTSQLCEILNLKEDGTPIGIQVKVTPLDAAKIKGIAKLRREPQLLQTPDRPKLDMLPPHVKGFNEGSITLLRELPVAGGTGFPITEPHTWVSQGPGGSSEPPFGCGDRYQKRLIELEKHYPRFENIMDCLHYKFENPFQAMLVSFKRFDPKHNNRVSENECLGILREYGLNLNSEDLHTFLRRILSPSEATGYALGRDRPPETVDVGNDYARIRPGQVPYKRLLAYYQNRAKGGPAHRILRELRSNPNDGIINEKLTLTPDEIEEALVKLLHKNYINFMKQLAEQETKDGMISAEVFRGIVDRTIGFKMTEDQWKEFKQKLTFTDEEKVNWKRFLSFFKYPANVASQKATESFDYTKNACPPSTDNYHGDVRDKATLLSLVEQVIRNRLHHIDKSYKHYDQKEEGMLSKEDFAELLTGQGLEIVDEELDYLWSLLDEIEPGRELHKYRQVMNYFFNRTRPIVAEFRRLKRYARVKAIKDPNLQQLSKWWKDFKEFREGSEAKLLKAGGIASKLESRDPAPEKPTPERLNELCKKIAPLVSDKWNELQLAFSGSDPSGSAKILWDCFKKIARAFQFPLDEKELTEICRGFDCKGKDYVNYHRFMKHFSDTLPKEKPIPTLFDERLYRFTNLNNGEKLTFPEVLGEIRKGCFERSRTLLEAFRQLDTKRHGILTMQQIQDLLEKRKIKLSQDDLYHLQTSFDSHMNGCITFDEFKRTAMKVYKPI